MWIEGITDLTYVPDAVYISRFGRVWVLTKREGQVDAWEDWSLLWVLSQYLYYIADEYLEGAIMLLSSWLWLK